MPASFVSPLASGANAASAREALILGLFGLGAAIPLVAAAYASRAGFGRVRQWVLRHGEQSKKVFGALLLLVGVVIWSGRTNGWKPRSTSACPTPGCC